MSFNIPWCWVSLVFVHCVWVLVCLLFIVRSIFVPPMNALYLTRHSVYLIIHQTNRVPLLSIPIIEAAFFQGLLSAQVASKMMLFCTSFSFYELLNWLLYDSSRLEVVDNRDSSEHSVRYLAGTLTYTSGKVLQCVLPAAILSLSQVIIGSLLFKKESWAGVWLLASGLVSLISCAIPKRPDVQLYGETASVGLLWATAACVF